MSNRRKLRIKSTPIRELRQGSIRVVKDIRPGADKVAESPPAGAVNGYLCETCFGYTIVIHRDAGVTPAFLACRAREHCTGVAHSLGYPDGARPSHLRIKWEWYRPDIKEYKKLEPEMQQYVLNGGLILRKHRG